MPTSNVAPATLRAGPSGAERTPKASADGNLSVLLVSYAFPPTGGVGVQRVLKLAKYLPNYGVVPSVLTVQNPSVPLTDASSARDIPEGTTIIRARTLEPGYGVKDAAWTASASRGVGFASHALRQATNIGKQLLLPDAQILWQPMAQRALGRRLFSQAADDVVFVTAPPFSQFMLGPLVRLKRGTALVLDYRDEWTTYRSAYEMMGPLSKWAGSALERILVSRAHAITTATEAFRKELLRRYDFLDETRVFAIPNGYDPDDFPELGAASPPSDRFVATYTGTVLKMTTPKLFFSAVRLLHEREPALARQLEIQFVGRVVATEDKTFEGMDKFGVRRLGFVEHSQVNEHLARSHLALCLVAPEPGNERIYPGKIFEIMYLGRPCLTVAPTGALTELVKELRLGESFAPEDVPGICSYFERTLRAFRDGTYSLRSRAVGIERFHRRHIAGEFARVFRQAVSFARRDGLRQP